MLCFILPNDVRGRQKHHPHELCWGGGDKSEWNQKREFHSSENISTLNSDHFVDVFAKGILSHLSIRKKNSWNKKNASDWLKGEIQGEFWLRDEGSITWTWRYSSTAKSSVQIFSLLLCFKVHEFLSRPLFLRHFRSDTEHTLFRKKGGWDTRFFNFILNIMLSLGGSRRWRCQVVHRPQRAFSR